MPHFLRSARRWTLVSLGCAVALVLGGLVVGVGGPGDRESDPDVATPAASRRLDSQPLGTTKFRIASFNLLGSGHTDGPRPPRRGWADSAKRIKWTRQILDAQQVGVVGFQEMHGKQVNRWLENNPDWGLYPALTLGGMPGNNSISWRKSEFRLIRARTIKIPYFNGTDVKMPYIRLRHIASGQDFWLYNTHNPANRGGDHQRWRDLGFARANDLLRRLRSNHPNLPVFQTGDMNDREKYFCQTVSQTEAIAANGGYADSEVCLPPPNMSVDWVMGTAPNVFTGYLAHRNALVRKTTDHPVIVATVNIPARQMQSNTVDQVVVVSGEGVSGPTVKRMIDEGGLRNLASLRNRGASTFNARTAFESTRSIPNLVSMLTGRPVDAANNGHGVDSETPPGTVHQAAGRHASSVLDMVHNHGLKTAIYTSSTDAGLIRRSWDATHGGTDPYGLDHGRNKLTRFVNLPTDAATVQRFAKHANRPVTYAHVHLTAPRTIGERHGFASPQYERALVRFNRNVQAVRRTINTHPRWKGRTLLVVTSTGGGRGRSTHLVATKPSFTVPLMVNGPGVPRGWSLYDLNPAWVDPGQRRVNYPDGPITTGVIPNFVLGVLKLPALPGSMLNDRQDFNVLTAR